MFSSYWLWIRPCPWTPPNHCAGLYAKRALCPFITTRETFSIGQALHCSIYFRALQTCARLRSEASLSTALLKNGDASKAYKAAVIIAILYPGGECKPAARQRKRPDRPRTFCRKLARRQSWHEAPAKRGQRHAVRNYVSVYQSKQASTHSLKSSWLDLKCVLTSWGQMGTISLYELKPFVTV